MQGTLPKEKSTAQKLNEFAAQGELTKTENQFIATRTAGDTALAKRVSSEIAYARASKTRITLEKSTELALDVVSISKSLKATLDLSAPRRQGWVLSLTHPKLGAHAFKKQLESFLVKNSSEQLLSIKYLLDIIGNKVVKAKYRSPSVSAGAIFCLDQACAWACRFAEIRFRPCSRAGFCWYFHFHRWG